MKSNAFLEERGVSNLLTNVCSIIEQPGCQVEEEGEGSEDDDVDAKAEEER